MTNSDPKTNRLKIKIDDKEYFFDSLPDEGKGLVNGLKTADHQIRLYNDTLKLINISKQKMIEDLRKIIENVQPA